jgi:hypothetical protein
MRENAEKLRKKRTKALTFRAKRLIIEAEIKERITTMTNEEINKLTKQNMRLFTKEQLAKELACYGFHCNPAQSTKLALAKSLAWAQIEK